MSRPPSPKIDRPQAGKEIEMVKKTYKNFLQAMEILQNQAYMTSAQAEQRTREITAIKQTEPIFSTE